MQRPPAHLVGMVHLPALPGSLPRAALAVDGIETQAVAEARVLAGAGFQACIVENFGDAPFHGSVVEPVTVAVMSRVVAAMRRELPALVVGVNVLRNDAAAALAVLPPCAARSREGAREPTGRARMSELVLVVNIKIKPENVERFMAEVLANARGARAEPGCKQFEVLVDKDDPTQLMLYEIYADDAAFQVHQQTPHFKYYIEHAVPLLASRARTFMRRAG